MQVEEYGIEELCGEMYLGFNLNFASDYLAILDKPLNHSYTWSLHLVGLRENSLYPIGPLRAFGLTLILKF